ncbi:MAG TPA: helix-turn-helix transcriptional regulator [Candidatus Limnocylindria bacterium]|nr:helix-turn-helix transcriptional regulator [Candidatus Limnocylindria bacterium]
MSVLLFTDPAMSPSRPRARPSTGTTSALARLTITLGGQVRDRRLERRWTLRDVAVRAQVSVSAVHGVEVGRCATLETYLRVAAALGLTLEVALEDRSRRAAAPRRDADAVHAAMGELEAARLSSWGFAVGMDEPYQHYQFAGRADLVAWDLDIRALLHLENRTRFPDLQATAGAWNTKRSYLADELAARLRLGRGWASVTHVMVALWTSEVLRSLRLRQATFRALCPDLPTVFAGWWAGTPPATGTSATLIVLDPCAAGRQRRFIGLDDALHAEPRHRDYAEVAACLRSKHEALRDRRTEGARRGRCNG